MPLRVLLSRFVIGPFSLIALFLSITFLVIKTERRRGKRSSFPDISQYFAEFRPTPKQLKKLAKLLKSIQKWWGVDWSNAIQEATLVIAPGELSQLTPDAYELLTRCQNRVWAFKVYRDERYGVFDKQTYGELFDLLLSFELVVQAAPRQKLKGGRTVKELRSLLEAKGLSTKGKKDVLVDRLIEDLTPTELETLVSDVLLFQTTELGDQAIETIRNLHSQMRKAFPKAVMGTYEHFRAKRKPPKFPPGVLYDDGVIFRITEEEAKGTTEELASLFPEPEDAFHVPPDANTISS